MSGAMASSSRPDLLRAEGADVHAFDPFRVPRERLDHAGISDDERGRACRAGIAQVDEPLGGPPFRAVGFDPAALAGGLGLDLHEATPCDLKVVLVGRVDAS